MYCTVAARVSEGKPARAILRVAEEEQADLIVMGVQGRGTVELMVFGSNAHAVIRERGCPVLVVPAPRGTYGGSAVGIGQQRSSTALSHRLPAI